MLQKLLTCYFAIFLVSSTAAQPVDEVSGTGRRAEIVAIQGSTATWYGSRSATILIDEYDGDELVRHSVCEHVFRYLDHPEFDRTVVSCKDYTDHAQLMFTPEHFTSLANSYTGPAQLESRPTTMTLSVAIEPNLQLTIVAESGLTAAGSDGDGSESVKSDPIIIPADSWDNEDMDDGSSFFYSYWPKRNAPTEPIEPYRWTETGEVKKRNPYYW